MRFLILSDLHLDFNPYHPVEGDYDAVILAGDIAEGTKGIEWAMQNFACDVYYVPGNHEYYFDRFPYRATKNRVFQRYGWEKPGNIILGNNIAVHIEDKVLLLSTMWTDFELENNGKAELTKWLMLNDSRFILNNEHEKVKAGEILSLHNYSKFWLKEQLEYYKNRNDKVIVVTHHGCSPKSVHPKYYGSSINCLFSSDLTDIIEQYQPGHWIHGHTHESLDYNIGNTRVICNPRGYTSDLGVENPSFNDKLIIEI